MEVAAAIIALRAASAVQPLRALGTDKPIDLVNLRRRYTFRSPLLHAEYGSASFMPVTEYADFDVRISTAGTLVRERPP